MLQSAWGTYRRATWKQAWPHLKALNEMAGAPHCHRHTLLDDLQSSALTLQSGHTTVYTQVNCYVR